jgi:hypothetical protein
MKLCIALLYIDLLNSPSFSPPPSVEQLPSGPENAIRQFVLGTCEIEEASYEGTLKVTMAEFFKQLNLNMEEEENSRTGHRLKDLSHGLVIN